MKNKMIRSLLVNCLNFRRIGPDPFFQEGCTASNMVDGPIQQVIWRTAQSCDVFLARLVDTAVDDHICECGQEMMEFKNWRVPAATLAEIGGGGNDDSSKASEPHVVGACHCICPCKDWKASECLICLSSGDVSGQKRR